MRMNNNNRAYLLHIRDSLDKISSYVTSHTFEQFENNEWDQAAVLRYLEVVGEAANKIDVNVRQTHSQLPWRELIDLRNVIIHDYMNVDSSLIWKISTVDVPSLNMQIKELIKKLDE